MGLRDVVGGKELLTITARRRLELISSALRVVSALEKWGKSHLGG